METIKHLTAAIDGLQAGIDERMLEQLREGMAEVQAELDRLKTENRDLRLRGDSLEQQVMELAREPIRNFTRNVILFSELVDDSDEPDFDPAA